jgi:hypothetical protein
MILISRAIHNPHADVYAVRLNDKLRTTPKAHKPRRDAQKSFFEMMRGRFGLKNLADSQGIFVELLAIEKRPQSDKPNEGEQKSHHRGVNEE